METGRRMQEELEVEQVRDLLGILRDKREEIYSAGENQGQLRLVGWSYRVRLYLTTQRPSASSGSRVDSLRWG